MSDLSPQSLTLVPTESERRSGRAPLADPAVRPPARGRPSFAWPTPPMAAYPQPVAALDHEPCEVEGRTGNLITGLMISFEPDEGQFRIQVPPERAPMLLRFNQVRRITLKRNLTPLSAAMVADASGDPPSKVMAHHQSQAYSVHIVGGPCLTGRTVGHVETPVGLFLFSPVDALGSVQRIFVPRLAIERQQIGEPLGQMLLEQQATTPEILEHALHLQQTQRQKKIGDQLLERQVLTPEQLLIALDKQARMPTVRLGEALVALGFLTDRQLQEALDLQRSDRVQPLGQLLVERGLVDVEQVRIALARKMGYPVVDVAGFPVDPTLLDLLPATTARRLQVLPLMRRGGRLVVAMQDASNQGVVEEVQRVTQCHIAPTLASDKPLAWAIERAYRPGAEELIEFMPLADRPIGMSPMPLDSAPAEPRRPAAKPAPRRAAAPAPAAASPWVVPVLPPPAAPPAAHVEPPPTLPAEPETISIAFPLISLEAMGVAVPELTAVAPVSSDPPAEPGVDVAHPTGPVPLAAERSASAVAALAPTDAEATAKARASADRHESPLLQTLAHLVLDALGRGATSLQIETLGADDKLQVRLRRNGRLEAHSELPAAYRSPLIARIKALSDLDVSETRRPQEGRLAFSRLVPQHRIDLRVHILPTQGGLEDVVLGLPSRLKPLSLDSLGMAAADVERLKGLLERPAGLILCVGPARSGRTTSLHASLSQLNRPDRRIWTLEDRIELAQPGLRQMLVHPDEGQTFETGLRSLMNTDADVLMVGHIGDTGTARMAVEAALQGRLVLGAMTARNACDAVMRLMDQGVTPWDLSDALLGVHSQRLLRRMCSACRMSRTAKDNEVDEWVEGYFHGALVVDAQAERDTLMRGWLERFGRDGKLRRFHSPGCERCTHTGQRGRLGVHELLVVSRELRRLIRAGAPAWNLQRQAQKDGMRSLRQDAVEKMVAGQVTLDEVRSVIDL